MKGVSGDRRRLNSDGEHTIQNTGGVSQSCPMETYVICNFINQCHPDKFNIN